MYKTTTVVVVANNNENDNHDEVPVISSLRDELEFDSQDHLTSHYVLYPIGCNYTSWNKWNGSKFQHNFAQVTGKAFEELFPSLSHDQAVEECPAVCIQRGVSKTLVHAVSPEKRFISENVNNRRSDFYQMFFTPQCNKMELCLMNYYTTKDNVLQVYWVDTNNKNELKNKIDIKYGEQNTICTSTFLGHEFKVFDPSQNLIAQFKVAHDTVMAFGTSPPSDIATNRNIVYEIENSLENEWSRSKRIQRTFSPLGFAKGRLPDDVFALLGAFYYNNQNNAVLEEWGGRGVFVNWVRNCIALYCTVLY